MIVFIWFTSYDKKDFVVQLKRLTTTFFFKQDTIYYQRSTTGDLDTILIYKIDSIQDRNN